MKTLWVLGVSAVVHAIDLPFQAYPDCVNGLLAKNHVCNTALLASQRAAALVEAMTREEKLQNLVRYVPYNNRAGTVTQLSK